MAMKSKPMQRRTFLKAAGAGASTISIGLPILDAMLDGNGHLVAPSYAQPTGAPLIYLSVFYPNGVPRDGSTWHPEDTGPNYRLSRNMRALAPVRDLFVPISGCPKECYNDSRGSDVHHTGHATFNTARATDPSNGQGGGPSLEWVLSQELGRNTAMPLLPVQLGRGHFQALWSGRSEPVDSLTDPSDIFDRIFGDGPLDGPPTDPLVESRRSVLDYVRGNIQRLQNRVGTRDRQRLDQHFESIRQLERSIAAESPGEAGACEIPGQPGDTDDSSNERVRLLFDLQIKAFECGVTRVGFFQFGGRGRQFTWNPDIGAVTYSPSMNGSGWHAISHDFADKFDLVMDDVMEQIVYLLQQMQSVRWADTTLLHNSVVFIASESESASGAHEGDNMPMLLAGNAGGNLQTGRAVRAPRGTTYSQVFLNILQFMGLEGLDFGDPQYLEGGPIAL